MDKRSEKISHHETKPFPESTEILLANARVGSTTVLYREENKYYIAESNLDNLIFMEDGQHFIMSSEKSGYSHLYLYAMSGKEFSRSLPEKRRG